MGVGREEKAANMEFVVVRREKIEHANSVGKSKRRGLIS